MPQRDVRALRRGLSFSQRQFARLLRLNVDTLRQWEMGRRQPRGPAAALLRVLAADPEVVLRILSQPNRGAKRSS